jgi:hypothetical protein
MIDDPTLLQDELAALRAERDQARSDLAEERVISARTARALDVASKALERIAGFDCRCSPPGWHGENCDTGIASRALTDIAALTGGPRAETKEGG